MLKYALNFDRVHFICCFFCCLCIFNTSNNPFPNQRSCRFTLMFSSVLVLAYKYTFWSILNSFLCIVWGMGPTAFFSGYIARYYGRDYSFSHWMVLALIVENQLTIDICVYSWTLNSIVVVYMSIFMPVSYCFEYCRLVVSFHIRKMNIPTLFFIFKIVWVFVFLQYHTNLGMKFSISAKTN